MDISQFLFLLLEGFSKLNFVEKVDILTEVFVLKGRAILKKDHLLQIYYNELSGTTAFALVEKDRRIWGIDYDNIRGWHLHPVEDPENHYNIDEKTVEEIIKTLADVWANLK
ncbi:MAG: hypothetical protein HY761_07755 [Candidatus Omnitrophica bacterium]|nr:hypothetical protein [Candidatus Omnitrophota bacterium]